jgi:methylated-DNA-protein-cysteine methyltransferase related protein
MAVRAKGAGVFARVHALVASIPRGRVATYGQLSEKIGRRLTPVGIGWALRGVDDRVPWHRVINAQGGISTRGESAALQRDLLEAEEVRFRADGTVDLTKYQWKAASRRR